MNYNVCFFSLNFFVSFEFIFCTQLCACTYRYFLSSLTYDDKINIHEVHSIINWALSRSCLKINNNNLKSNVARNANENWRKMCDWYDSIRLLTHSHTHIFLHHVIKFKLKLLKLCVYIVFECSLSQTGFVDACKICVVYHLFRYFWFIHCKCFQW